MIALPTLQIESGDRYGKLTVLAKIKTKKSGKTKYRVGCECGNSSRLVRATDLTKGRVKACLRCENRRGDR